MSSSDYYSGQYRDRALTPHPGQTQKGERSENHVLPIYLCLQPHKMQTLPRTPRHPALSVMSSFYLYPFLLGQDIREGKIVLNHTTKPRVHCFSGS